MLGAPRHLVVDLSEETAYSWVKEVPEDSWTVGEKNHPNSVEEVIEMSGATMPHIASDAHRHAFKEIGVNGTSEIPWRFVLGQEDFDKGLRSIIQAAQNAVCYLDQTKYAKT